MPNYVYSTLATDVRYTKWLPATANDELRIDRQVLIKGGANVADKRIITPRGVVTEVTNDDVDLLMQNEIFQIHFDAGHVTIERSKQDAEIVAADMTTREPSSPLVPEDYAADKQPKTGAPREQE